MLRNHRSKNIAFNPKDLDDFLRLVTSAIQISEFAVEIKELEIERPFRIITTHFAAYDEGILLVGGRLEHSTLQQMQNIL